MAVDISSIKKFDLGALAAGGLVFILSLVPAWVTLDVEGEGTDLFSASAIDSGFNAWQGVNVLALLLLLLATAAVAVKVFAPQTLPSALPVGVGVIAAGLAALGTIILVIRTLTTIEGTETIMGVSISQGPGWSGWLLMVAAIALTVFAALSMRESGETLPWQTSGSTSTGTSAPGPTHAQSTTPPPAGRQPPPAAPPAAPPAQQPPASPPPGGEGAPPRPPV